EASNILHSTDKFLEQNKSWLSDAQSAKLQELATDLKTAVAGTDKDAINRQMETLNEFATPLAHEALDRNVAAAIKGQSVE
ncbi:MAG: Hsp70 family protein, partial [Bacteroidota bacterium]